MSNERPNTAEIRKRLDVCRKMVSIGDAIGIPEDNEWLSAAVFVAHLLQWVLGEESEFNKLYEEIAECVRSSENIRQQNYEQN